MNVLVACEFSGVVRDAFFARGHWAWSVDLLPTESNGLHRQGCIFKNWQHTKWDLMIGHPPCTHLAVSGAMHFDRKRKDGSQLKAIEFFMKLWNLPIKKKCLENPVGIMSTFFRKPDQYIQPWQFGHPESKKTGLWLENLPKLVETENVKKLHDSLPRCKRERSHYMSPSPDRGKKRSITYKGIARAMAEQWG